LLSDDERFVKDSLRVLGLEAGQPMTVEQIDQVKGLAWSLRKLHARQVVADSKAFPWVKRINGSHIHDQVESPIEDVLLRIMNTRSVLIGEFTPQFSIGPYRVDFAFKLVKLYVEADGRQHYTDPGQMTHDQRRGLYLAGLGWEGLRFKGRDILRDPYSCIDTIERRYSELLKTKDKREPWERIVRR
jgi:very-short-patch-repair endonuclease